MWGLLLWDVPGAWVCFVARSGQLAFGRQEQAARSQLMYGRDVLRKAGVQLSARRSKPDMP
jgi:hypothetical protein